MLFEGKGMLRGDGGGVKGKGDRAMY